MSRDVEPVRGVSFDPQPGSGSKNPTKVWRARVHHEGVERTLGRFATVSEANEHMEAYRASWDALVVSCTAEERAACSGCKGLRFRMDEPSETVLSERS